MKKLIVYTVTIALIALLFTLPIIPVAIFGIAAFLSDLLSRGPGYLVPLNVDISDMSQEMQNELYEFEYDPDENLSTTVFSNPS